MAPPVSILEEIRDIMHTFGDSRRPLIESAKLVEEILRQQMKSLIFQANEAASLRKARSITHQELLFLMRNDKEKLVRLLNYLEVRDGHVQLCKNNNMDVDGPIAETEDMQQKEKSARVKPCVDFLRSIDTTGELSAIMDQDVFDVVKSERAVKQDCITQCMDRDEYLAYTKAREAGFRKKKNFQMFHKWMYENGMCKRTISALAMEIITYLAYETVAQIVDLALIVKHDATPDPMERLQPPLVFNTACLKSQLSSYKPSSPLLSDEESTASSDFEPVTSFLNAIPSEHCTPAKRKHERAERTTLSTASRIDEYFDGLHVEMTPTQNTEWPENSHLFASSEDESFHELLGGTHIVNGSAIDAASTSSNGAEPTVELVNGVMSPRRGTTRKRKAEESEASEPHASEGKRRLTYYNCIYPDDIREAVNRYFQSSGPFICLSKINKQNMSRRLLCC